MFLDTGNKIESLDFHGMNNYLVPLSSVARPASDNTLSSDFLATLTIGDQIEKHFYARIAIKEYTGSTFNATIDVIPEDQYTVLRTEVYHDILTCSITPSPSYEISLFTTLEVEDMPVGTEIDLTQSIRAYDFSATIDVPDSHEVIIDT